ncbi:Fur-regulated basic protein FbpA [Peribacillus muralis]|uniref:Fur-regulated basic protein FbpA n=1 Tax=Peribacillus muralis TaxID=264697 RepID=UPI00070D7ADB|nr:Fur-regulated basic protein FbpA [Peribacillus muralis]
MGMILRQAIETKRNFLINKLINTGVYQKHDIHLFEWTLTDLEEEYMKIQNKANPYQTSWAEFGYPNKE